MATHPPLLIVFFMNIATVVSDFDSNLHNLTEAVIGKYFQNFACITYVLSEGVEMDLSRILPVFLIRLPAEREIVTASFEQGCGGYVVRVDNKLEVAGLLIDAKHRAEGNRYNREKYLFLPMDEGDVDLPFLNATEMFYLPNLVLITPEKGVLSAVTHTHFNHHKHDRLGIVHEPLDVWAPSEGFRSDSNLFPDKVSDVMGKKFVFAVVNYSPFSLVRKQGNETFFDGFETRIAAEFVEIVNGTWEGLDHPVDLWGVVFPNGSGNGVVGSVIDHRADFGFSAFYQWFCEECDCTYPFYQSGVTCLVPRPELVSGWLTIVLPFTNDTWVALVIVYFISSSFVWGLILAMQHQRGFDVKKQIGAAMSDSFFTNFRIQLEQIPIIRKTKEPLSIYVKIAVYYYFFVAAFWQGGIASILTVPRFEKPINDVPDLLERWPKIKWGANSDAWVNSIRASSDPNLVQIVKKFTTHDDDTLKDKTKTKDFAFFVEKLPHGHYGYNDYITEESMKYLRLMESNIYTAFGVLILPRGSPYSEKFDRIVHWLYDTGIIHKIEVQISLERINNRLQNMIENSNVKDTNIVILAVRHIQGPIIIYIGGMSLALLAFACEILHHRRKPKSGFINKDR